MVVISFFFGFLIRFHSHKQETRGKVIIWIEIFLRSLRVQKFLEADTL